MKTILILIVLTAALSLGNPIIVQGQGSFAFGYPGINIWSVSFAGGSEETLTSGSFNGTLGTPLSGMLSGSNRYSWFGAYIDGQYFSPGFAWFFIGNEDGAVVGYDQQHQEVVRQALIASITVTNFSCGEGLLPDCSGAFTVHAPEPAAWHLFVIGLVFWWRFLPVEYNHGKKGRNDS